MTARSASKVKGAPGISRIILLLFLSGTLHAQTTDDVLQRNVTIIGSNIHFEDVLEQLTLQTKVRFIYSSSMVSLEKPVTLIARQQSLKTVFDELSSQMNVSFKKQGDYFVVKRNNSVPKSTFTLVQPKLANSEDLEPEEFAVEEDKPEASRDEVYSFASYRDADITKDLLNFGDRLKLKYYPLSFTENVNGQRRKQWFASAGLLINDYGAGVELQGGIPLFHTIVNVSALGGGQYRLGYGFGTGIPLKPGVTANLAYTFAALNREEIDTWHNQYNSTSHHHQLRFMATLSLSAHFSVRIGPTFNLLRTSYQYIPEPNSSVTVRYRQAPTQQYLSLSQGYTSAVRYAAPVTPSNYETTNSWVGFELGVAYRVNFSLRK
jgi:hypothetical protein